MLKLKPLPHSPSWLAVYALAAIVVVMAVFEAVTPADPIAAVELSGATVAAAPVIAPEVVEEQLDWARRESLNRLESHFAAIDELFRQARTAEFCEICLGWESKWLLAKDQFTNAGEHRRFIADAFRRLVLDSDQLQRLLHQCTASYQQELNSVEGEFYVRIGIDAENLADSEAALSGTDANSIHQMQIISGAISASQADVPETIAREAVSWAVSEVASSILMSLGKATGVVSEQEAESGWTPFATNVAVGMAVDKAITEATDPVGKLQSIINRQLAALRAAVLEGSPIAPGVLRRMQACAEARSEARRAAIQSLVPGLSSGSTSKCPFEMEKPL